MTSRRTSAFLAIAPLVATCVALAAPVSATPRVVAKHACSTSANPPATKYNTTPAGPGPWHVPLDKCNSEARGFNRVPYERCTYWTAEKRPDVWAKAVNVYYYKQSPGGAWNVELDARKAGLPNDHTPKVGDVAVWGDNVDMGTDPDGEGGSTASPGGHVDYVEAVNGPTITLSGMGDGDDLSGGHTYQLNYNPKKTWFIHKGKAHK